MSFEPVPEKKEVPRTRVIYRSAGGEAVYGLGLIGAWIYFISNATTFWEGVLGFLKGIVWPAFLVYELLKYLKL